MTADERREFQEFNGRMIEEMCRMGAAIVDLYAKQLDKELSATRRGGLKLIQGGKQ